MYKFIRQNLRKQEKDMDSWYKKKISECTLPEDVVRIPDISYIEDGRDCHKLDIYYPKGAKGKLPVILDFHGGGLLLCSRKVNQWFCCEMARRGFLVFCIDYPLVPQSDVYDILRDSYEGVRKSAQLLEKYGGDGAQISLCGDSAGAFISTYLAGIQNSREIAASLGITRSDLEIKAVGTVSGMFYTSRWDRQGIFLLRKDFYGKSYKRHPFWPYVNPENHELLRSLPPVFGATAGGDYLRDYTLKFLHALKKAGGKTVLADYEDNTGLEHDFVCLKPEIKESQEVMDQMAGFLRECK